MAEKSPLVVNSSLVAFVSESLKKKVLETKLDDLTEEETSELSKAKEFFGVEDLKEQKKFTLSIEAFLWGLFDKLEVPESPLRAKAHEKFLQEVASALDASMGTDKLPELSEKALSKVLKFVDDPELFKEVTCSFEFTGKDDTKKVLPLPALNALSSSAFLEMVDEIFEPVASDE